MTDSVWVKDLLIVLAIAGVVVPLFGRLRFGIVPGFLIAGVIVGPGGLGHLVPYAPWLEPFTFAEPDRVEPFADLGVVLLLFLIGLDFSVDRLWSMRRMVLGLGSVQFILSSAVLVGALFWYSQHLAAALVMGMAFALSSTAIDTQVLIEARRFTTRAGRTSLAILLFQDLMVVPLVIVVGLLGGEESELSGTLLSAVGLAAAAIAIILVVGRFLLRPLMRLAAATGSRDLLMGIAMFLAIGTSLLTSAVGLSAALGAFLAGMLLSESEYRHQLEVDIEPFKGLLLGFFFLTVGMSLDLLSLELGLLSLLGLLALLIVIKIATVYGAGRLFRVDPPVAIEAAFVLAGAGEFAFIIFTLASGEGILQATGRETAVAVAVLSMLTVPVLANLGRRAADALERRAHAKADGAVDGLGETREHVILGGFGRVGETVARALEAEQIRYVALDVDGELVARKRSEGSSVFYGDASRREILERVGGANARSFLVTTDQPEAAERMVRVIRRAWPDVPIHARALDPDHASRLREAGATDAVPEALEGSLQLAARVLAGIGLPDDAIDARLDEIRRQEIRLRADVREEESAPRGDRAAPPS